MSLTRMGSLRC